MIVEWNTHLFSSDTATYPFHPVAPYLPSPERRHADPLAAYVDSMESRGVDRAVLVHPEPYGDDHRLVLDCAAEDPERFRATSLFFPRDREAPQKLEALVDEYGEVLIATRIHSSPRYLETFEDPGVERLWEAAAALDQIVELHLNPGYAESAATQIAAHPDTPVVIDHLAEPQTGDAIDYADVLALAEYDNVYMKFSALDHFADDGPLFESVRPFTRWVIDAFGPDRMIWGKGSPEVIDAHFKGYSSGDRAKVKGETLLELGW